MSGLLRTIGAKPFAVGGALLTGFTFLLLIFVPMNFSYSAFAFLVALNGFGSGLFSSPNSTSMMNSAPPPQRGAAAGMLATFLNSVACCRSAFSSRSWWPAVLRSKLPFALFSGLTARASRPHTAAPISHLPPIGVLFSSFLGYNPMQQLLGPLLSNLASRRTPPTLPGGSSSRT